MKVALALALAGASFSPDALWSAWPAARFVATPAPCLDHEALVERLDALQARHPTGLVVEEVGRSVEGRGIHLLTLGRGRRHVLLWSQMHGDEPSATPALLDLAHFLLSSPDPAAARVLNGITLLLLPMLNPDGAERYVRENAQGIDVNRDAMRLATPEGRLLRAVRDRFEPMLGFNLHDQDRRSTVRTTGHLATLSLLAVAGDAAGTMTSGRARAQRACSSIVRALGGLVPGGIARYDEDWNPRAFGDNITAWGTPVVLIESGGLPPGWRHTDLTRLNFVALLSVLSGLVRNDLADADPVLYESLARNARGEHADVLVSRGRVWQPGAGPPYPADLAFDRLEPDPLQAGCARRSGRGSSRIVTLGDARLLHAAHTVHADGRLLTPTLTVSVQGLAARGWLGDAALEALGRLGVGRLRWHVAPADHVVALGRASDLAGPGRPALEVTGIEEAPCVLELHGPPGPSPTDRLDGVLDGLTHGRWRHRLGEPSTRWLTALTTCGSARGPRLAPDRPASFMLLRPSPAVPPASGPVSVAAPAAPDSPDPGQLILERVFIDGREPPPPEPR